MHKPLLSFVVINFTSLHTPKFVQYIGKFPRYKRFAWKISRSKIFAVWAFHAWEFNTWRKRWGVWKRLVHSWRPRLSRNLGAATVAVTQWWQAYLPISARTVKTILPVWPRFPTRCGTDGFFHFLTCGSNRLGWYWRRQRTSWIRNSVTVICCRKNFVCEIFVVTDNRKIF